MDIIGQAIRHKMFGSGVITALDAGIMTVKFQDREKKFIYPDAFKDFLILKDEENRKYIVSQIAKRDEEANRQRLMEQAEQQRKQRLLNFTIAASSHAVFNILPENVDDVKRTCTVSTGKYLSGYSKGKPRIADRMKPNSAVILTVLPTGAPEQDRQIFGAFMVREDFFGDDTADGIILGHPSHQMFLPASKSFLFWEHFSPDAAPRWGNTAYKYCSGSVTNHILSEMTQLLWDTPQQETSQEFYKYFCKINRLASLLETKN